MSWKRGRFFGVLLVCCWLPGAGFEPGLTPWSYVAGKATTAAADEPPEAVKALIDTLKDKDPEVRRARSWVWPGSARTPGQRCRP